MAKTLLTPEQFKEAASIGAPIAEVRDLAADGYSFEEIKGIYEAQREAKFSDAKAQGVVNAQSAADLKKQDEKDKPHKQISAFSYPEGDIARPRPKFKCRTFWVAEELSHDLTTAEEIELLNQIVPGEYRMTRSDGTASKVTVTGQRDELTGALTHMRIMFETRGAWRHNLPTRVAMCREIIAQQPKEPMRLSA